MLKRITPVILVLVVTWCGCQKSRVFLDNGSDTDSEENCSPGEVWCDENNVAQCNETGDGWIQLENCTDQGLVCAAGECVDTTGECATAINQKSYIGCEYWAVNLANVEIDPADYTFAVAVANDGDQDAELQVTDGATVNNNYTVPAGEMIVIQDLPWKIPLHEASTFQFVYTFATRKVANGAYHITSTMPVTVYQFNPLEYCMGSCLEDDEFSVTNDASLLLPVHIFRDEYMVISRATNKIDFHPFIPDAYDSIRPGLVALIGPDDGPTTVEITFTSHTLASDSESNEIYPAFAPGQTATFVLQPYEVLQLFSGDDPTGCPNSVLCCDSPIGLCCEFLSDYDLTGSVIRTVSGPDPAVFSGTVMSRIPFNIWAADHLEQQMFPLETWGTHYLCGQHITQAPGEPAIWRVVSGSDSNQITFNPSSVQAGVTLNRGEFVEFESLADFEVSGQGRVAVAQFMCGQQYTSVDTPPENGDPAMSLGVPVEQYRTNYTFLAPDTYIHNYLTAIHETGAFPVLDGTGITGDTVEIASGYSRTNLEIEAGIHRIESAAAFGITVYGVGWYTSYMYPGGLDLKKIDIPIE